MEIFTPNGLGTSPGDRSRSSGVQKPLLSSLALLTSAAGAVVFGRLVTVTLLPEPKGISLEELTETRPGHPHMTAVSAPPVIPGLARARASSRACPIPLDLLNL
jgi:hypothetical protein